MTDLEILVDTYDADGLERIQKLIDDRRFKLGCGRYSTGKIYRIVQIDKYVLVYVGSTIRPLDNRFGGHRGHWKHSNDAYAQYIRSNGGPKNFRIELIMTYPCRSFQELLKKEGYFIRLMKPLCNIMMTGLPSDPPALQNHDFIKYADIDGITQSRFESIGHSTLTMQEAASIRKYVVANSALSGTLIDPRDAATVYDGFEIPLHYRWFKSLIHMQQGHTLQCSQLDAADKVLISATSKAFIKCTAADEQIHQKFVELKHLLKLESFHDVVCNVSRVLITANLPILGSLVTQIKFLLDHPNRSVSNASSFDGDFRAVTRGLNTVFSSWLGLSFSNIEARSSKKGGYDRPCVYRLSYQSDYSRLLYTCGIL